MSERLDPRDLAWARANARRRMPNGERMVRFRWAERDGTVWLFPAAFFDMTGRASAAHRSRWEVGEISEPVALGFWIAVAARQDLWRRLQGVSGLMPVVRVRALPEERAVEVTLAAVMPETKLSHAVEAVLADMFQPKRMAAWTDWAAKKAARATAQNA